MGAQNRYLHTTLHSNPNPPTANVCPDFLDDLVFGESGSLGPSKIPAPPCTSSEPGSAQGVPTVTADDAGPPIAESAGGDLILPSTHAPSKLARHHTLPEDGRISPVGVSAGEGVGLSGSSAHMRRGSVAKKGGEWGEDVQQGADEVYESKAKQRRAQQAAEFALAEARFLQFLREREAANGTVSGTTKSGGAVHIKMETSASERNTAGMVGEEVSGGPGADTHNGGLTVAGAAAGGGAHREGRGHRRSKSWSPADAISMMRTYSPPPRHHQRNATAHDIEAKIAGMQLKNEPDYALLKTGVPAKHIMASAMKTSPAAMLRMRGSDDPRED